ncbi:DNA adenine methylase [Stenotrophomonas sepilia]
MPKPIISWPGGTRRLLKHLYPHFPIHDRYVEAFAGGAASLLMRPYPAQMEVLNDINGELVSLYRCVCHHLDEFMRKLRLSQRMCEWAQRKCQYLPSALLMKAKQNSVKAVQIASKIVIKIQKITDLYIVNQIVTWQLMILARLVVRSKVRLAWRLGCSM